MKIASYFAVAALLSACGAGNDKTSSFRDAKTAAIAPPAQIIAKWDASQCGDDQYQNEKLERHPSLMGLTPQALATAYGAPSATEDFVVGQPFGTFYGVYGKRRSGPKAANDGAPARVITWTKTSCNFSVFFLERDAKWVAVEAFEWAVGADF